MSLATLRIINIIVHVNVNIIMWFYLFGTDNTDVPGGTNDTRVLITGQTSNPLLCG